jgi:hypothetical protein
LVALCLELTALGVSGGVSGQRYIQPFRTNELIFLPPAFLLAAASIDKNSFSMSRPAFEFADVFVTIGKDVRTPAMIFTVFKFTDVFLAARCRVRTLTVEGTVLKFSRKDRLCFCR